MSTSDVCVRVTDVTVVRQIQHEASMDLKRSVFNVMRGRYRKPELRVALHNANVEVRRGDRLGIIGLNGAGKSTLLKVIAGIVRPTSGTVWTEGLVAPLIELGAGFDPELSVADNVVLYGVLLGLSRETMTERVPEVIAFAELEQYRDTPVKTLSSGMLARLGFAVASDVSPEVLLIDEVLSVGDEHFRKKSRDRIMRFWEQDTASVIVSHDLYMIGESCDRVICMQDGAIAFEGSARTAIRFYLDTVAP